jgi:predicted metalloendopeptidase
MSIRSKVLAAAYAGFAIAAALPAAWPQTTSDSASVVRPQDDLLAFAHARASRTSFERIDPRAVVDAQLLAVLEQAAQRTDRPLGSARQLLGDFYAAFMDTARVESLGLTPLAAELAQIDGLRTSADVSRYLGHLQRLGVDAPLTMHVSADPREATRHVASLRPGGLTLPGRIYYLNPAPKYASHRAALLAYIERLLALGGHADAFSAARRIEALETRLANYRSAEVAASAPARQAWKVSAAELARSAPGVDWFQFLHGAAAAPPELRVEQPAYAAGLGLLVKTTPVSDWRAYFKFRLLDRYAPLLPARFADLHADFHVREISGGASLSSRQERALGAVKLSLGALLAREYCDRHCDAASQAKALRVTTEIIAAFERALADAAWWSDEARTAARAHAANLVVKIGAPEVWTAYAPVAIRSTELIGNVMRAAEAEFQRRVALLGKPVDPLEWQVPPYATNIYYDPAQNELTVPFGAFVVALSRADVDPAADYAGVGARVAAVLTTGLLRSVRADAEASDVAAEVFAIAIAQRAQQGATTVTDAVSTDDPTADGLSAEQRFFVAWAQSRRPIAEPIDLKPAHEYTSTVRETDVNGIASRLEGFQAAFQLQPGDKLYRPPQERVRIR